MKIGDKSRPAPFLNIIKTQFYASLPIFFHVKNFSRILFCISSYGWEESESNSAILENHKVSIKSNHFSPFALVDFFFLGKKGLSNLHLIQ